MITGPPATRSTDHSWSRMRGRMRAALPPSSRCVRVEALIGGTGLVHQSCHMLPHAARRMPRTTPITPCMWSSSPTSFVIDPGPAFRWWQAAVQYARLDEGLPPMNFDARAEFEASLSR